MQFLIAVFLAVLSFPSIATAADIFRAPPITDRFVQPFPGPYSGETPGETPNAIFESSPHFRIEGEIEPGDVDKLGALLKEELPNYQFDMHNNVVISLNSDGGSFYAGLALSDLIASYSVATYVGPGDRCLSSCAIAFLGGQNVYLRGMPQVPARYVHAEGTVGFHSPFSELPLTMQIPDGTPFSQSLGGQMAAQFYGQAQAAINELARRMEAWQLAPDFVFGMLGMASLPDDTRPLHERFVLVNNYWALSQTRTTLLAPVANRESDIGIVGASNACNFLTVANTDRFFLPFGRGFGYASFVNEDVIAGGKFLDRDKNGNPIYTPIETSGMPVPRINQTIIAGLTSQNLVPAAGNDSFFFESVLPGAGPIDCNVYRAADGTWVVQTHNGNVHYGPTYTLDNSAVDGSDRVLDYEAPFPINSFITLGPYGVWNNFAPMVDHEWGEDSRFADVTQPSFDCAGTLDPAAELICAIRVLARQDGIMGQLYPKARNAGGDSVLDSQRHWLKTRDRACRPATVDRNDPIALRNLIECLYGFYAERNAELDALAAR